MERLSRWLRARDMAVDYFAGISQDFAEAAPALARRGYSLAVVRSLREPKEEFVDGAVTHAARSGAGSEAHRAALPRGFAKFSGAETSETSAAEVLAVRSLNGAPQTANGPLLPLSP
eukprot:Skav222890  [mRNA]  locus=scaffold1102:211891:214828:- [translate_table: standard]